MIDPDDESAWATWRAEIDLDPDEVYLNAGSFSPVPREIEDAADRWRRRLASSPMRTRVDAIPKALVAARKALADYIDTAPNSLILLSNVTYAVNLVARSIPLKADDEILVNDHEYGAMKFCWQNQSRLGRGVVRTVVLPRSPESPRQIEEAILAACGPRTRVLFLSHITSPTALTLPVENICREARARGIISVVDGAHSAGMIPLSVRSVNADFYGGNCHKWMMTPAGAGYLAVHDDWKPALADLVTSWGYEFEANDDDTGWGGSKWSQRVEVMGTTDRTAQLVLPETIAFRERLTDDAVHRRSQYLSELAVARMSELGFTPVTASTACRCPAMTAFEIPPVDPIRAREWIWDRHRISIPFTQVAGQSFLRISTAWFNQPSELDRLTIALREIPWDDLR